MVAPSISPTTPEAYESVIPPPLRDQVRDAIERAWSAAIATGSLPDAPSDADRPQVEVERPAKPEHGDISTNLAMKLARPYRKPPMEIATLLATKLVRDAAEQPDSPIEAAEVAPPGFINLRLRPAALARTDRCGAGRAGRMGTRRARSDRAPSTSSSSRPTRPGRSPSGTRVAPSSATC